MDWECKGILANTSEEEEEEDPQDKKKRIWGFVQTRGKRVEKPKKEADSGQEWETE